MTNYEKYKIEIAKACLIDETCAFIGNEILRGNCNGIDCNECKRIVGKWLNAEYEEPQIDWSKVEVDTRILVKMKTDEEWKRRHFAGYEDGYVFAWSTGNTSYTTNYKCKWDCAELAEEK